MPTTNPRTQVTEEPEPTLRDVLVAVNGIGTRLANVESDVGTLKSDVGALKSDVGTLKSDVGTLKSDVGALKSDVGVLKSDVGTLKFEMASLAEYTRTQFTQQSLEIANLRADVGELRTDVNEVKIDLTALTRSHAAMVPLVHESLELGRSNRDALRSLKEDVALLTSAAEGHHGDHEIHLPRARSAGGPLAGPMAA